MIDEIANISGDWGAIYSDDFPSPKQLDQIEREGWLVAHVILSPGTAQVSEGQFVIYMRRMS